MRLVQRYDLEVEPTQTIQMPFNSEILGLAIHHLTAKPMLHVLADTAQKEIGRTFIMVAEGKELGPRANRTNAVGTILYEGHYIYVFEE